MAHNVSVTNINKSINVESLKRNQKSKMKTECIPIIYFNHFLGTPWLFPVFIVLCLLWDLDLNKLRKIFCYNKKSESHYYRRHSQFSCEGAECPFRC